MADERLPPLPRQGIPISRPGCAWSLGWRKWEAPAESLTVLPTKHTKSCCLGQEWPLACLPTATGWMTPTPRPPTSTRGGRRVRAEWKPAPAPPFSMPPDCYPRQRAAAFAGWSREGPGVPGQDPGRQEVGNRQLKTHPRKAVSHVRWGSKPQQMLHSPIRLHLQTPIWS